MLKLFKVVGSLVVVGAAVSAAVYYLQKKGFLRVEVNYDNKEGQPITRSLDEIVETTVADASGKVTGKVTDVVSDVKSKIEQGLEATKGKLDRKGSDAEPAQDDIAE